MNGPTQLKVSISWLGILNYLGAILSGLWVLYLMYGTAGPLYTLLALLISCFVLRFGASPLFAIAASIVHFHFEAAGLWFPLLAYVASGIAFYNDLLLYRARQTS
jgi:hypothetical protein